jgi:hypothetical protein
MSEATYQCARCGKPMTKEEGGTTFTVCDTCWGIQYGRSRPVERNRYKAQAAALKAERDSMLNDWRFSNQRVALANEARDALAVELERLRDLIVAEWQADVRDGSIVGAEARAILARKEADRG